MKLTGKNKFIGGIAIAGALAVTGLVGFAQQKSTQEQGSTDRVERQWGRGHRGGQGMKRGFFGGRMFEKLNLTDAQKEQMKQIATRYHESNKSSRDQSRGRGKHDLGLFDGGTFNEAAVRAAAQERANKQVEREVARARMMSEMYSVLTPEQKAQLTAERQQMEQKRQERRARRGATSGQISN